MEIDRIDKDNIRVFLVHKDLEERGVTILDLLGNQMQVEKFFYSILEEVDTDHSFSGPQSITFQVMPNEDGLELLISKSPQEYEKNVNRSNGSVINPANLFNMDSNQQKYYPNSKTHQNSAEFKDPVNERYLEALKPDSLSYVAKFDSIDDLINLGHFLTIKVKTQLFVLNDDYYAVFTLYKKDSTQDKFSKLVTNVNEYGYRAKISPELLAEHGKLLIKNNIFRTLDKYF
ncbi:adaptor protein MecA [Xylocopilactobacillus apis]|uniref:Adapter protein MecA n=1 Tax=Xylocopilactobacillus apis TaxID=2932183 RepID=A0AAU9DGL6_9LACO|nr:adaptor protein MecA [Xylocopilactobacillus apis]BDR55872.1 adapter protein MecA [Xylocopilactobacillus apis]